MQRARQPLSRLAWVASRWQGTSCSSSFVSKVLGANWKSAKFAMCTGQDVTFEPTTSTSNAHAHVDYNTLSSDIDVIYSAFQELVESELVKPVYTKTKKFINHGGTTLCILLERQQNLLDVCG